MQFIKHKLLRIFELGPRQSLCIAKNKISSKIFELRWRRKALSGRMGQTFNSRQPFPAFAQKELRRTGNLRYEFNDILITQANLYTQNIFDILGSGPQQFTHIPWHEDFRLKAQNP